jgi:hypothetical protein
MSSQLVSLGRWPGVMGSGQPVGQAAGTVGGEGSGQPVGQLGVMGIVDQLVKTAGAMASWGDWNCQPVGQAARDSTSWSWVMVKPAGQLGVVGIVDQLVGVMGGDENCRPVGQDGRDGRG